MEYKITDSKMQFSLVEIKMLYTDWTWPTTRSDEINEDWKYTLSLENEKFQHLDHDLLNWPNLLKWRPMERAAY